MDGAKKHTFEELHQIVGAIASEYGILKVYLFGSRARGDNRPDSDYDFCIVAPEGTGLFKMGGGVLRQTGGGSWHGDRYRQRKSHERRFQQRGSQRQETAL